MEHELLKMHARRVHLYNTGANVRIMRDSSDGHGARLMWRSAYAHARASCKTSEASGTEVQSLQHLDPHHSHFLLIDEVDSP